MSDTKVETSTEITLQDEAATLALGALLAKSLSRTMTICLSGDLGAGKTTITRGFLRACGYQGAVKSPTFTLVESYLFDEAGFTDSTGGELHHFDLYRIEDPEELDFIGFEEYFEGDAHVIVEWPVRAGDRIGDHDFYITISHESSHRRAKLCAVSEAAKVWLNREIKQNKFKKL